MYKLTEAWGFGHVGAAFKPNPKVFMMHSVSPPVWGKKGPFGAP